jgi:hypothetical protein
MKMHGHTYLRGTAGKDFALGLRQMVPSFELYSNDFCTPFYSLVNEMGDEWGMETS